MIKYKRFWTVTCFALAFATTGLCIHSAEAVINVAGELVVDLRAADLEGGTNTWENQDTLGDTAGNFTTQGGGSLNVALSVSDTSLTVPFSLDIDGDIGNAVIAQNLTPASIISNETRSAETWVFSRNDAGTQTPVGWGSFDNDMDSSFSYNNGGNGMFNGWFNDGGWTDPIVTGEWIHLAWSYDGDIIRGYRNGVLAGQYDTVDSNASGQDLDTPDTPINVGSARGGFNNAFSGYIADVRVHTGVLSAADVLNNFNEGIAPIEGVVGDFDGDGDLDSADLGILRSNLFAVGTSSEGDINRDGIIDWTDWRLFKDNPLRQVGIIGPSAVAASVPEPSSFAILTVALATLLSRVGIRSNASLS